MNHLAIIAIGLVVGFLVGLTGMGGGAMMTPLLVLSGWAKPAVAVGTDLLWGSMTKAVGATVHYRQHNVNLRIVARLAAGSLPGAVLGIALLHYVRRVASPAAVDHLVLKVLGVTIMMVALGLLARTFAKVGHSDLLTRAEDPQHPWWRTALLGLVVGFLVGVTSVGSGSLIIPCLLWLYPQEKLSRLVGTDVFHALLLVSVSALGHWQLGTIDVRLALGLLLGSVPGVWIGSRMATRIPDRVLRPAVAGLLLITAYKML